MHNKTCDATERLIPRKCRPPSPPCRCPPRKTVSLAVERATVDRTAEANKAEQKGKFQILHGTPSKSVVRTGGPWVSDLTWQTSQAA